MMTNKLKYLAMAIATALVPLLISCDSGDDPYTPPGTPTPTPTDRGKFLTQTLNMTAGGSEVVVALTGLSAAISRTSGSASWLTITPLSYVSGTPQVKLTATANLLTESRQQDITFFAAKDTLLLTVHQKGAEVGNTDVYNPTDTPTDQPAYSSYR